MSQFNQTVTFPGDGFVNVSSVTVFPPVWGGAASIANSGFYLILFLIYSICFIILVRAVRRRIDQNLSKSSNRKSVLKKNHLIMFILAGTMVAIQCANLVIRILSDILFIQARITVEDNGRITYSHYVAMWILTAFSTFFMFLNYLMLFVILFFVQMVFWRTAATMRAISMKTFKNIRIFSIISISLFLIATGILLILHTLFVPLTKFDYVIKTSTTNYIMLGIILLLFSKDTVAIVMSGVLVIKTIRKSIQKIKNVTQKQLKMENPFIVTFSLLIGLIICILLQILAVIVGAVLVTDREELKFVWHFINCAGILIFSSLTLALFYPMFIQTESVFKELHIDDTKSTISTLSESRVQSPQPTTEAESAAIHVVNNGLSSGDDVLSPGGGDVTLSATTTAIEIAQDHNSVTPPGTSSAASIIIDLSHNEEVDEAISSSNCIHQISTEITTVEEE